MVTVSVVMPVYHTERFLHEAIESVLNQTLTDLELIAICDPWQEEVHTILDSFKDPRLQVIDVAAPVNVSVKMNCVRGTVSGQYVARMDSDDICYLDRLEKQVEFLKTYPSVDVVGGQIEYITEDGARGIGTPEFPTSYFGVLAAMPYYNPIANPTFMMRRDTFNKLWYDPAINTGVEDYDYWVRAVKRGVVIRNLPDAVLKYRLKNRDGLQTEAFYNRNSQRAADETKIQANARGLIIKNIRNVLVASL